MIVPPSANHSGSARCNNLAGDPPSCVTAEKTQLFTDQASSEADRPHGSVIGSAVRLAVSYEKVGDVQKAQGNLPAALASYQARLAISDRLAKSDPGNGGWQRDLSISYSRVGDVQKAQGNLSAALTSYQESLAVAGRLAKSDPSNAGWKRDLAVCYSKVGDVQAEQGDLAAALTSYQADLAIMERLAKSGRLPLATI